MLTQIPEALNAWAEQTPLLGKGGVDAPSRDIPVPLKGADGVVRPNSKTISLDRTTPSAPVEVASRHFLNGRSHPSFAKEGTSLQANFANNQNITFIFASTRKEMDFLWRMSQHYAPSELQKGD